MLDQALVNYNTLLLLSLSTLISSAPDDYEWLLG